MKSNITFTSNIYKLNGCSKLGDRDFLSKIVDRKAIDRIVNIQRRINGQYYLPPLQDGIYMGTMPCAYAENNYGVIRENEKLVFVNKCNNKACEKYELCSSLPDFRKPNEAMTVAEDSDLFSEEESDIVFDIDLPVKPRNAKLQKLKVARLPANKVVQENDSFTRINEAKRWAVRGFWRRLPSGDITWVESHQRHHDDKEITAAHISVKEIPIVYRFKYNFQAEKLKDRFAKRQVKINNTPEAILERAGDIYQLQNVKQITSAQKIIESSLTDKILVNAGPGTGKTHTVIERLKYVSMNYDEVDLENVLVLCFSRSAVKVIKDRLSAAINSNEIPAKARDITIVTFDSFATWYLMQIDDKMNLTYLSYDERIDLFIREYEQNIDRLNDVLEYLIVDEIQDLVGVRAKLVKSLLKNITCGFLLLGDECQAIYDYQITSEDDMNAAKLYQWIEENFKDLAEYELTTNWRLSTALEKKLAPLRMAMMKSPFSVQHEELDKIFKTYAMKDLSASDMLYCFDKAQTSAILSWSNGDAYRQSQALYIGGKNSNHKILTGSRKLSIRKELALILSDFSGELVSRGAFYKLAEEAKINKDVACKVWEGIMTSLKSGEPYFNLQALRRVLVSERGVDEELVSSIDSNVIISTIHKSKGREFDNVILNTDGNTSNANDIKVYYVALTRSKRDVIVKKQNARHYDEKTLQGRYLEISKHGKLYRMELGIDGDLDPIGFISNEIGGLSVVDRQKYIRDNVHVGDRIEVNKYNGAYMIVHNSHIIGGLNGAALSDPHRHFYPSGKYFDFRLDKYAAFKDLYVTDIVTIVNNSIDKRIPSPYNKSGMWLGIELCGYAKPMEE